MNKMAVLTKIYELNLPAAHYVVVGGATLAVHNIRDTKDIDIVVTPELFELLLTQFELDTEFERKWGRRRLYSNDVDICPNFFDEKSQTLQTVDDLKPWTEIIEGIPFQRLEHLLMGKRETGRKKDLEDIQLINNFLKAKGQS